jgi:hypothetical protein
MTPSADSLRTLVDDMLLDAGHAGDAELRGALLSLGSLAHLPVPAPSGQLARLMAGSVEPADAGVDYSGDRQGRLEGAPRDELALRRRLRRHRPTVLGLALIAGMGTGIGGVAASSPMPGQTGSSSVQQLLEGWSPSWSIRVQAAAGGLLPSDAADSIPEPVTGEPATEPGSTDLTPADVPPQQQELSSGQQLARGPYALFLGSPAAGNASRGKGPNGTQETGHGRPASEAPTPDGGIEGEPGLDVSATSPKGQPADAAGFVSETAADPLKEVARHGGDAIEAVAGTASRDSWLQKFTR